MLPFDLDAGTAVVADGVWAGELAELGIRIGDADATLAVGGVAELPRLLEAAPRAVLVEGDGRRALRRAGYDVTAFITVPSAENPHLVLPRDHPLASAYALKTRVVPSTRPKELRRDGAAWLLRHGVLPPFLRLVTVGHHGNSTPFLVAAAERHLEVERLGWFLVGGSGDALSRGVFFLFRPREPRPRWVLKFARVRGYDEPFRKEETALREARSVGPVVADHSPEPAAMIEVGGRAAAIETAGLGRRLDAALGGPGNERDKLAVIERVLHWLLELAAASRAPRGLAAGEWRRLQEIAHEASIPVADEPFFDPVLQHNDLGAWNVVVDGERFTAVDWESSRRYGAPLWDGWYFLVHALPQLAGVPPADRDGYVLRLLRGEDTRSELLFRWTRRAAAEAGVERRDLGTLAALCWLHHAHSHPVRAASLEVHAPGAAAARHMTERLPALWLRDEGLGVEWRCLDR